MNAILITVTYTSLITSLYVHPHCLLIGYEYDASRRDEKMNMLTPLPQTPSWVLEDLLIREGREGDV